MANVYQSSRDVILRTRDWEQATAFYGSVLGLPVTHQSPGLIGFETGAYCLYVEQGAAHGPVFEFLVHDLASAKAQLLAAGCVIQEEQDAVPRCYLRDPYGLVFNLRARAAAG
ncbi:VOC family protein [Dyella soli]|uniref:Glyoxalase-like domain-containing protein n=1 Tax=Dyella soli TaxID=522319 RepID=A0A4R0YN57_9GAMM|nr:VOC family protein [Dyella soli]TCI08977.1 hypothetical protein EZM97_22315 [Dyella soli]